MTGWGISCHLKDNDCTVVIYSVVEEDGQFTGEEILRHKTSPGEDWPQKLYGLATHIETLLKKSAPDAVVIRSLDFHGMQRRKVIKTRYQVEGVVIVVVRRSVQRTEARSGQGIGDILGISKDESEAKATGLFGKLYKEEGAAALAAIKIAGR